MRDDPGSALDVGDESLLGFRQPPDKPTSCDALLTPPLSDRQLSLRMEHRHLCRGSGTAGRPIILASRTEYEIPAICIGSQRGSEYLDVVDLAFPAEQSHVIESPPNTLCRCQQLVEVLQL